jgi:hypothetical protein
VKQLQIDEKVFKCRISRCDQLTTIVVNEPIGHLRIRKDAWVESLKKIVNWSKVVCSVLFFNQERVDLSKDELIVGNTVE